MLKINETKYQNMLDKFAKEMAKLQDKYNIYIDGEIDINVVLNDEEGNEIIYPERLEVY